MSKMFYKEYQGFSLVELLVITGIIALLTGFILFGVISALNRSKDAAVERDCYQVRIEAAQIYADNASFSALCSGNALNEDNEHLAELANDIRKYNGGQDPLCYTIGYAYCVSVPLFTSGSYCIDSSGYAGKGLTTCDASAICY